MYIDCVCVCVTADFGFARHLNGTDMAATLCGSPLYMVSHPFTAGRVKVFAHCMANLFDVHVGPGGSTGREV